MNRFVLIALVILISADLAFADGTLRLQRKISWNDRVLPIKVSENETKNVFCFDGAVFPPEKGFQPYFSEVISTGPNQPVSVKLVNPVYRPAPSFPTPVATELIPETAEVEFYTGTIKKSQAVTVLIPALRKNPFSGNVEQLIAFELVINLSSLPTAFKRSPPFKTSSVLSTGTWYKIAVSGDRDGIYKIDYAFMKELGVNPDNLELNRFKIYGNGGGMLPEYNAEFRHDDLQENAIWVIDLNGNGWFNQGDYILFYGQSPHRWKYDSVTEKFRHRYNVYSDFTYYFINTDGSPTSKRWSSMPAENGANLTTDTYDAYEFYEKDRVNLMKSGREWYGGGNTEYFNFGISSQSYSFSFSNAAEPVFIKTAIAGRSTSQSIFFNVAVNGQLIHTHTIGKVSSDYTSSFAYEDVKESAYAAGSSQLNVTITLANPSAGEGWLNYIEINGRRKLVYEGAPLFFRDTRSVGSGNVTEFTILNAPPDIIVLDVTNPVHAFIQQYTATGNEIRFAVKTDSLREFVAFADGAGLSKPVAVGKIENQNLHAINQADMIIVTHPSLMNESLRLKSFHESRGLTTVVADIYQIYNEFSSGAQDITAIRDFVRMLYQRATDSLSLPDYLLLMGDGSYDYKDIEPNNTNLIPTYQSYASLNPLSSYVTDDYFGFLDDSEGPGTSTTDLMDIAIGRFPVSTPRQAADLVNKILHYHATAADGVTETFGNWRNVLCFVADDEDGALHMIQADNLTSFFESNYKSYNLDKIFLDAYPQQSTPGGSRYPEVNEAINRRMFSGALIMNYTGHGGINGWAHERILDITMINSWKNFDRLPLFITATCEFSKFDEPGIISAGEMVLLNPKGGAIAMVTTTRLVFAHSNFEINNNFLRDAFTPLSDRMPTIGESVMRTKNKNIDLTNKRKFVLLGDPALMLAYPKYTVVTTEINEAGAADDTLKALKKISIRGEVRDHSQNRLANFNGVVYSTIYDKATMVTSLKNDPGEPTYQFNLQKSIIYNGKASVDSGRFYFEFIIPKDIDYHFGTGKISYYSHNGYEDANGYTETAIGGTATDYVSDTDGPQLSVFMNDEKFAFGGVTNPNPLLLVKLYDQSGINTVGTGIGHDITAVLDGNTQNTFVLNEYYEADLNSYQTGKVQYPLENLPEGRHSISVKAWDTFNNSAEGYTEFVVADDAVLALKHVFNYPNPFTTNTRFLFEHNRPGENLLVTIRIMTVSGKVVKTITQEVNTSGFRVDNISWDGLDDYGDAIGRGVYIYKLHVKAPDGSVAHEFEKLVILR
ncbi:MAG: peptidase C25 [Chitinophagales bacterium]|nr:MAG: peptidase C25 [Chitinophagales bacterium]